MELDLSREWRIFLSSDEEAFVPPPALAPMLAGSYAKPEEFAVAELASGLGLLAGLVPSPGRGDEGDELGVIILNPGPRTLPQARSRKGYAWRASPSRVEIHADSGPGLIAGVEAFLEAAGLSWPGPGCPPSLARKGRIELSTTAGRRPPEAPLATLILGHGSYFEAAGDYLVWAARNGYAGVFFHTTAESPALGAIPLPAYEAGKAALLPLIASLGLEVELGGHGLSSLLPRRLFKAEPELFRMGPAGRSPDSNLCPSSQRGLEVVSANFSAFVAAHPEAGVFHVWPDDLPGGGWCACPACAGKGAGAQSLAVAIRLAAVLKKERPGALLSFLAYHDTEDLGQAADLPSNLELLWAPRRRSWARAYGDPSCGLNAASASRFEAARGPFSSCPRPRVSIFEYWEDAVLFKTAVPPLGRTMAGDLLHYAPRACRVGILLTGDRLPLAPRPNPWLLPRLLASASTPEASGETQAAELARLEQAWRSAVFGGAAAAMGRYGEALEEAWMIDLELEPGDTEIIMPRPGLAMAGEPPVDWGDPWVADLERLAEKRARCDALFDRLRSAEAALADAAAEARRLAPEDGGLESLAAVEAEAREYAISSAILELDCARLSAYHEAARGQAKLAADLALMGLGIMYSARKAMAASPDPRARKNGAFLLELYYGLRLRSLTRAVRGPLVRGIGLATTKIGLASKALGLWRAWDRPRIRARQEIHF
jgi:hypothetical protein